MDVPLPEELTPPTDERVVWSIERFFLFSLVVTFFKLVVAVMSSLASVRAIAVDAFLDLLVSGLGLYLVQWKRKVFSRPPGPKGDEVEKDVEVSEKGVLAIALVQGLILVLGGVVLLIQNAVSLQMLSVYSWLTLPTTSSFPMVPAIILALMIPAKFYMYNVQRADREATDDNVALKSIESNLMFDVVTNSLAWLILVFSANWFWPVVVLDYIVAIGIGGWMVFAGVMYLKPFVKYVSAYLREMEQNMEGEGESGANEGNSVGNT
ncbi:MAG: hypothetical protein ACTSU5_02500 [Promethearchaeota archaeon]